MTPLIAIAVAGLVLTSGTADADCMMNRQGEVICGKGQCQRDIRGRVRCSAFHNGSAVRATDGRILCGRGECIKTSAGEVFCSTEPEGAAMKDGQGIPRCQGQCERASTAHCEARPAGSVPE